MPPPPPSEVGALALAALQSDAQVRVDAPALAVTLEEVPPLLTPDSPIVPKSELMLLRWRRLLKKILGNVVNATELEDWIDVVPENAEP